MIKREVCQCGYDSSRKTFTQYYGSEQLDASLLMLAPVGFLPPDDERIVGTVVPSSASSWSTASCCATRPTRASRSTACPPVKGISRLHLLVSRQLCAHGTGRRSSRLFDRLLALTSDVGLLSEKYDPIAKRMLGIFRKPSRMWGWSRRRSISLRGQAGRAAWRRITFVTRRRNGGAAAWPGRTSWDHLAGVLIGDLGAEDGHRSIEELKLVAPRETLAGATGAPRIDDALPALLDMSRREAKGDRFVRRVEQKQHRVAHDALAVLIHVAYQVTGEPHPEATNETVPPIFIVHVAPDGA